MDLAAEELHPLEAEMVLLKARVDKIEQQMRTLAEANLVLARGLEAGPLQEAGQAQPEHAARLAHELLLAAGLIQREGETP
jgi:hypothetical protein